MFSQFRRSSMLTIGLTIAVGLILAIFSMRKIVALEMEAAARYQEIAIARAELKQLSARLVDAQENDRRAISRELHDEVGQALTGVRVELANLSQRIRMRDTPGAENKLEEIKELVEESLGVVRNMALLLRPSMLDDLGLVPALQWQGREVSKRTGLRVRVAAEGVSEDLPGRAQDLHLPHRAGVPAQLRAARRGYHGAGHRAAGARMHPDRHSGRWQRISVGPYPARARHGSAGHAGTGGPLGRHILDRHPAGTRRHGFHRAAHPETARQAGA